MSNKIKKLKEINDQISKLKKQSSDLERDCRKESRDKLDSIPKIYSYEIVPYNLNHDSEGSFRILRRLENYDVYQEIISEYGYPTFSGFEKEETNLSVSYYRKGNIVTHEGGGYLILEDPFQCKDDEWELLKSGDIKTIEKYVK